MLQEQESRLSFMSHPIPLLIAGRIFGKKVSLIISNLWHQFYPKFCLWPAFSVSQSCVIWKSSLELNLLMQNSVQHDYFLESFALPCVPWAVSPFLPKNSNINWFWSTVDGYPPLYKGMGVGVRRGYYERVIYDYSCAIRMKDLYLNVLVIN